VDFSAVAVIALLLILVAVGVLVSRQGLLSSNLPALRLLASVARQPDDESDLAATTTAVEGDPLSSRMVSRASTPARSQPAPATSSVVDIGSRLPAQRSGLSPSSVEVVGPQLDRLEARLSELTGTIDRHEAALSALFQQSMGDLAQRAVAGDARIDAAVDRLRADVLTSVASMRLDASHARRQDVCAELYSALARFEAALATVSNPVLLPGEPYAIPDELPASALVWENWNDVGERVFVLADTFNAQRLHLSSQTRSDLAQFLTTLRTLLTGTIYPNLQSSVGSKQHESLRLALSQIALGLRRASESIEREYEGHDTRM
jgi:hypothetical protein